MFCPLKFSESGLQPDFETRETREKFEILYKMKSETQQICEPGFFIKQKSRE